MIFLVCSLLLMPWASYGQETTGYNNSCLYEQEGLNLEGPTEFDCPKFVIESTDQIWNMYRGKLEHMPWIFTKHLLLQILTR